MIIQAHRVRITTPPTQELITVDEAKLYLRIDSNDEDSLVSALSEAACIHCEDLAKRSFITRTLRASLDQWPTTGFVVLPLPPLIAVSSITYIDSEGNSDTVSSAVYGVDTNREPGRVYLNYNQSWPSTTLRNFDAIQINYTAGYGPASVDVPERYKQATKMLMAHWYENRLAVYAEQGLTISEAPLAVDALCRIDRGSW